MNQSGHDQHHFFQLMNANGAVQIYREALRIGLFDALAQSPQSLEAIVRTCRLAERPAILFLDALVALGMIERTEDRNFSLTHLARSLLASPYRMLGDLYWSHLPAFLQTNSPMAQMDAISQSEAYYAAQAEPLGWMCAPAAFAAAHILVPLLPRSARILDLGAGSAIWSLSLAQALTEATITALDWPAVLAVAEKTGARMNLKNRLSLLPGNYHEVAFPSSTFDIAILANITHLESPEANISLLQRAHAALKPNALTTIIDILPGQSHGDVNRALYSLGLALRTRHARVYSPTELESFLTRSGFADVEMHALPAPPFALGMITAKRG